LACASKRIQRNFRINLIGSFVLRCSACISGPETPATLDFFKFAEARAPALKVKLVELAVHDTDEIERTVTAFAAEGNGGLIVPPHAVTTNRDLIVGLSACRLRLPAIYPLAFYARQAD
jgi:hypothetical protein